MPLSVSLTLTFTVHFCLIRSNRMATKRKLEFADYSDVTEEVGSADVHGVLTQLSPLKKSKKGNNYYQGRLCDGNTTLRVVGFASKTYRTC